MFLAYTKDMVGALGAFAPSPLAVYRFLFRLTGFLEVVFCFSRFIAMTNAVVATTLVHIVRKTAIQSLVSTPFTSS